MSSAKQSASPRQRSSTRARVAELIDSGLSRAEIAVLVGVSRATVSYHARRLGVLLDDGCAKRYDWGQIQDYYDAGHSVRECMARFGFSSASWFKAVQRGAIIARSARAPIELLLAAETDRSRGHLKRRLLREGLKRPECERCGLRDWQGMPLALALHHINGIRTDNRLENLALLCPNCHSQTPNFAGRNRPREEKAA